MITDTRLQVDDALHERADQRGIRNPFEHLAEPRRVGAKGISGARARLDPGLQIVQVRVDAGDPVAEIQKNPTSLEDTPTRCQSQLKHMHKAELDGRRVRDTAGRRM